MAPSRKLRAGFRKDGGADAIESGTAAVAIGAPYAPWTAATTKYNEWAVFAYCILMLVVGSFMANFHMNAKDARHQIDGTDDALAGCAAGDRDPVLKLLHDGGIYGLEDLALMASLIAFVVLFPWTAGVASLVRVPSGDDDRTVFVTVNAIQTFVEMVVFLVLSAAISASRTIDLCVDGEPCTEIGLQAAFTASGCAGTLGAILEYWQVVTSFVLFTLAYFVRHGYPTFEKLGVQVYSSM